MRFTFLLLFLFTAFSACRTKEVKAPEAVYPIPSPSQLAWHEMEMNAFVHFTTNTFTGKEWGYGDESPEVFMPSQFDPEQWISLFKEVGFKGVILTCKHHDGFCLWPSRYTQHSVKASAFMNGEGDIVKAVSEACKKFGLKFGIYLSPWDRNHADYGTDTYITYYRNQLEELFISYGPIFEMWFDGANGGDGYYGGSKELRKINGATYYQWPETLEKVVQIQPEVIFFSDAGPGVRWVGNERGIAGETNWCSITPDTLYAGKAGIEKLLNEGSEEGTHWIPAETDVSIRPGWFYHEEQDTLVKSPEKLFDIYLTSVGRGSTLLLNVPPDKRGLIHENDVRALKEWRRLIDSAFKKNLALHNPVTSGSHRGRLRTFSPENLTDGNPETYWATDDPVVSEEFEIDLQQDQTANYIILQEYIKLGQRVKAFSVSVEEKGSWKKVATGTTIGYKRILKIGPAETRRVKVEILDSKACPVLSNAEVY